jgi:hypothetical protein
MPQQTKTMNLTFARGGVLREASQWDAAGDGDESDLEEEHAPAN